MLIFNVLRATVFSDNYLHGYVLTSGCVIKYICSMQKFVQTSNCPDLLKRGILDSILQFYFENP